MKKILILFAFIPVVAFGQFSKGSKSIGGLVLYNNSQDPTSGSIQPPTTYFSIDSQLGFFLTESVAIGPVLVAYSNSIANINPQVINSLNQISFRPKVP